MPEVRPTVTKSTPELAGEVLELLAATNRDDAEEQLATYAAIGACAPALARFVQRVDRLSAALQTSRSDHYGNGWNDALAQLRRQLGLEVDRG